MKMQVSNARALHSTFVRLALATGLVLLIPLVATQLSDEVAWSPVDFVVMGALLFGGSLAVTLASRRMTKHRALAGAVIVGAVLWLWAELAVGVLTPWGS